MLSCAKFLICQVLVGETALFFDFKRGYYAVFES